MTDITFKGNKIHTIGDLPKVGSKAKDFELTNSSLSEDTLKTYKGKRKVLFIVPSLNTSVCGATARKFNEKASALKNTVVLVISADLPFASKNFCEAEGLKNVIPLSTFRSKFPEDFGVKMIDGPLRGLNARVVIVLDESDKVIYTQQVPEITQEPDYEAILKSLAK